MNFKKIKETCLYVHNLELTKKFYHEMLGLPIINYAEGKHIFFRAGDSVLLCFNPKDSKAKKSPPAHYGGGKQHFAFEVTKEDYENVKMEILQKGITIIDKLKWKDGQESFYFEDLEGNILEIEPEGIWD
jgi:catechol-2,3-dioxygenase